MNIIIDTFFISFSQIGRGEDIQNRYCKTGEAVGCLVSMINHSCIPNAHWVGSAQSDEIIIVAERPIKKDDQVKYFIVNSPYTLYEVQFSMF